VVANVTVGGNINMTPNRVLDRNPGGKCCPD
jgi:hypothetical protein